LRGMFSTLATVWRISTPYFRSEDRWPGLILLAAVIAIELSIVAITVLYNSWNNAFYNALQEHNWSAFVYQLGYFCILAAAFILLAVYQLYLNQWLQIRWRRWMTRVYLEDWLASSVHYRMQLQGDAADNPDQRISEDIRQFIELTLTIGLVLQAGFLTLYLALRERAVLAAIFRAWRPSLFAGFMGATASEFWFLAFALTSVANVRTLALVEVLFAQAISLFVFKQTTNSRDALGIALIVIGVLLLIWVQ